MDDVIYILLLSHGEVGRLKDFAVNNLTFKIQEELSLTENPVIFLNVDPSAERSRKFKRVKCQIQRHKCLAPYREIYNNLQSAGKVKLQREEDTRTLNEVKSSKSEVIKAYRVEKKKRHLERERLNSIRIRDGKKPKVTFGDNIRRCISWRNWPIIGACLQYPCCLKLIGEDGSFRNFIFKSVFGFLGGIAISYLFFLFLIFQLNFKISTATGYCSLLVIFLSIGLAFSQNVRCFVFLLLPTLFSKRGRQALMAYAVVLALAGPAANVLHNAEILSKSLSCGQEKMKTAAGDSADMIKQPLKAIKEAVAKVTKSIKDAVKTTKETILNVIRVIKNIVKIFVSAFRWLGSIANICNRKLGTPSERCIRSFAAAIDDCVVKLGPLFSWLCSIAKLASLLCHILKILDLICELIHFVGEQIVSLIKRKMEALGRQLHDAFYVEVTFSHTFNFKTNSSTSLSEVMKGIGSEVRERTRTLFSVFSWMGLLTSLCFLLIFVKHKYLTNDKFDNHYISRHLYDIDARRMEQNRETILPLKPHEKRKYIEVTSLRLVGRERLALAKSTMLIFLASIKLAIYIITDHCLHWLLLIIREYGNIQTQLPTPNMVGVHVEGKGPLANLYQGTVNALQPLGKPPEIDTSACLPNPRRPDTNRHIQIAGLLLTCWVLTLTEPYGQRLRHIVMNTYHPERAGARAAWLYNQILRSRLTFLKFTRRQLRSKFSRGVKGFGGDGQPMENVTLRQRLAAMFPKLGFLFGPSKSEKMCILCGAVGTIDEKHRGTIEILIACKTLNCQGVFCQTCFKELHNICTLCKDPVDYGDLSDISEEQDSSDEPQGTINYARKKSKNVNDVPANNVAGIKSKEMEKSESSDSSLNYEYQEDESNHLLPEKPPSPPYLTRSSSFLRIPFIDVERQSILDLEDEMEDDGLRRRIGENENNLRRVQSSMSWKNEKR